MKTPRSMKAWLVTWEWMGNHAKRDDKIAAVLNSRLSAVRVKEVVEFIYLNEYYTLSEKMACAQRKMQNPYPARIERVKRTWPLITCGHNPFLTAQLVDDLNVQCDSNGCDVMATWKTLPSGELRRAVLVPNAERK